MNSSTSLRSIARPYLLAVAIAAFVPGGVSAQDKPVVRVLVGFPPGAGTDNLARAYAEALAERLNVTAMVENKTGAGGQIAAQALKQAPADSNSLMVAVDHQVVMLPLITRAPGFDVKKDMVPVGRLVNFYTCLAVPAASPVQDLQGYIDTARKSPAGTNDCTGSATISPRPNRSCRVSMKS